jgi:hypothetical protein
MCVVRCSSAPLNAASPGNQARDPSVSRQWRGWQARHGKIAMKQESVEHLHILQDGTYLPFHRYSFHR